MDRGQDCSLGHEIHMKLNHPNIYFMQSHDKPVMVQVVYSVVSPASVGRCIFEKLFVPLRPGIEHPCCI